MSENETSAAPQTRPELPTFGRARLAPGVYYLDLEEVATFPLTDNGQPSTFGDIYRKLRDAKIVKVPDRMSGDPTFETEAGEVTVGGEWGQSYVSGQLFIFNELRDLISLLADGIDPHRARWFYFGHDWSRDGDEIFMFFVVYDGKIVRERVSFMHCYPRVLQKDKVDDDPIWHAERYEQAAWVTYWYRKFYTETLTGQLMVIRPDVPILYDYDRSMHDVTRDVQFVTVIKAYRLLWVAVSLLVAIAFPMLRPYMAGLAVALMIDLLWRCWATRKVGSS